jgi:hypothetical protein
MKPGSEGFSEETLRLAGLAKESAVRAISAAFEAGRPVHEAGTGLEAGQTFRVWPDGRRELVPPAHEPVTAAAQD